MSESTSARSALLSVLLGGFAVVAFCVFMTMLTAGFFGYILVFVLFLAAVSSFHWVVWGALLSQRVAKERDEERLVERAREEPRPDDERITNRPAR